MAWQVSGSGIAIVAFLHDIGSGHNQPIGAAHGSSAMAYSGRKVAKYPVWDVLRPS